MLHLVLGGSLWFRAEAQVVERPYILFHGHVELFQKRRFFMIYFIVFNYTLVKKVYPTQKYGNPQQNKPDSTQDTLTDK